MSCDDIAHTLPDDLMIVGDKDAKHGRVSTRELKRRSDSVDDHRAISGETRRLRPPKLVGGGREAAV
jgi:hypothetical protein